MERLPDELLINIFSRLPLIQIQQIRKVRKKIEYFFLKFFKKISRRLEGISEEILFKIFKTSDDWDRDQNVLYRMYYKTVQFLPGER